MTLEHWRSIIDTVDKGIVDFLAIRMAIVGSIAQIKSKNGFPVRDENRERDVLVNVTKAANGHGLNEDLIRKIFTHILEESGETQEKHMEFMAADGVIDDERD